MKAYEVTVKSSVIKKIVIEAPSLEGAEVAVENGDYMSENIIEQDVVSYVVDGRETNL